MAALFRMERGITGTNVETAGRVAVESLLVVTIGVLFGRLAWTALAPSDTPLPSTHTSSIASGASDMGLAAAGEAPAMILTRTNPFAADAAAISISLGAETTLDLKLSGVRAVEGHTAASSAVISFPDGAQKRFVPGDEVMPGVVLVNVTGDAAHLSRDGRLETLSLNPGRAAPFFAPAEPAASGTLVMAAATTQEAAAITPTALAADTVMMPEMRSGRVSGYRLEPRGGGAFEAAGLESGDLILRVNGQPIEGLQPDQIHQSVASGSDVALDVVRQGAIVRLRVSPNAGLSQ
jgi:type II secretion system protein C